MKKVTILLSALMLTAASYAQTWTVDKAHSKLGFTVTHMMVSDVEGSFKTFDATITSSKPDFADAVFTMTAVTKSINTDNEKRDEHLRSADFFDAEKNPTVTFVSKFIKKDGDKKFKVTGDLTMHGVTKPVTLDISFKGPAVNPMSKKDFAGFKVSGKINRKDFGIGASMPNAMLSEEVILSANGEFTKA